MLIEQLKLVYRAARYRWVTDRMEVAYLLRHINKCDTAFDIGAHKGGYTYWMLQAAGRGNVVAFEPQEAGALLLQQLYKHKVRVEHKAVSKTTGTTKLYVQPQQFDVSFEASLQNKYENSKEQVIETVSLDDYCKANSYAPSFLKIDVEGHELPLLQGATEVITNCKPFVLIEAEVRHIGEEGLQAVFELLQKTHRGFFFTNGSAQPLSTFNVARHQDLQHLNTPAYCNNFAFEPL